MTRNGRYRKYMTTWDVSSQPDYPTPQEGYIPCTISFLFLSYPIHIDPDVTFYFGFDHTRRSSRTIMCPQFSIMVHSHRTTPCHCIMRTIHWSSMIHSWSRWSSQHVGRVQRDIHLRVVPGEIYLDELFMYFIQTTHERVERDIPQV